MDVFNVKEVDKALKALATGKQKPIKDWLTSNVRRWVLNEFEFVIKVKHWHLDRNSPEWAREASEANRLVEINIAAMNDVINHYLDWATKLPERKQKKLVHMHMSDVKAKTEKWISDMAKNADLTSKVGSTEEVIKTEIGKWVQIKTNEELKREGALMRHCVGAYNVESNSAFLSLRDDLDMPHATVEVKNGYLRQVKGFANAPIKERYLPALLELLETDKIQKANAMSYDLASNGILKTSDGFITINGIEKNTNKLIIKSKIFLENLKLKLSESKKPFEINFDNIIFGGELELNFDKNLKITYDELPKKLKANILSLSFYPFSKIPAEWEFKYLKIESAKKKIREIAIPKSCKRFKVRDCKIEGIKFAGKRTFNDLSILSTNRERATSVSLPYGVVVRDRMTISNANVSNVPKIGAKQTSIKKTIFSKIQTNKIVLKKNNKFTNIDISNCNKLIVHKGVVSNKCVLSHIRNFKQTEPINTAHLILNDVSLDYFLPNKYSIPRINFTSEIYPNRKIKYYSIEMKDMEILIDERTRSMPKEYGRANSLYFENIKLKHGYADKKKALLLPKFYTLKADEPKKKSIAIRNSNVCFPKDIGFEKAGMLSLTDCEFMTKLPEQLTAMDYCVIDNTPIKEVPKTVKRIGRLVIKNLPSFEINHKITIGALQIENVDSIAIGPNIKISYNINCKNVKFTKFNPTLIKNEERKFKQSFNFECCNGIVFERKMLLRNMYVEDTKIINSQFVKFQQ